jgi:thiol-disulfide isomerase/thioredoxin
MRCAIAALLLACMVLPLSAQQKNDGPQDEKAQKTYKEAFEYLRQRKTVAALENFKKADKQDGDHCVACQKNMIKYGRELGEWKIAEQAAEERVEQTQGTDQRIAHYDFGSLLLTEAIVKHKDDLLSRAHEEMSKAIEGDPKFPDAIYADGRILARLKQDDAARLKFEEFTKLRPETNLDRQRALRYIAQPELARARMAPPFAVTTLDGQKIFLDDLQGKVVLLDFWATWCGPCRAALPHMQSIAKNFAGQPLVVLSISLDTDEQKWKDFIAKNNMTWAQYYDGGFTGSIAKMFDVHSIPHTFTIDADGVLQDENIGDASIEGKLKKLVSRAKELQTPEKQGQ